jgi:hypothetical protein
VQYHKLRFQFNEAKFNWERIERALYGKINYMKDTISNCIFVPKEIVLLSNVSVKAIIPETNINKILKLHREIVARSNFRYKDHLVC